MIMKEKEAYKALASLVLTITLVFSLLFSLFFIFFPLSEFSLPFLLTIPVALLSTLFLVTLRKKKGSQEDDDLLQAEEIQRETAHQKKNGQEAETQSDSSFPSDSEESSNNGSTTMDEKIELNAIMNSSIPSSDSEISINGSNLSESFEIDQNSTRILGIYESLTSESDIEEEEEEEEDGLIEINLPSSHFSDLSEEDDEKLESKLPDFLTEAMFKQEDLMELLAEINEMNADESLIEIDISGDQCVVLSDLSLN